MGPRISEVWQYVRDGKCTLCPEMKISTKKSSNILRHIRRAHSEVYQQIMTNRYAPPMHNKRTDFTMVQQSEMVQPSEMSIQDDLEHNDHDADLSHTIDQLFGTSSMGAIFGDSCVKMVRRSHFWSFVHNKRCSLCGETLNSSHASNIRKHFLRKHRSEYEQIVDEQQQMMVVQQLITRGTTQKKRPKLGNYTFSVTEPNNNNFSLNGLDEELDDDEDQQSSSFHSNQPASIEILDGEELDMSRVGEPPIETMADFARLLVRSQLSSSGDEDGSVQKVDDSSQLVADLMRQFYDLGWVFGSGGAMCIRVDNYTYVTPTSVQKDRLRPEDIGVYNQNELVVQPKGGSVSSCINLFWTIFRTNEKQFPTRSLNSVIHTHSLEANLMASFPIGSHYDQVHLGNEEMLKGIMDRAAGGPYANTQTLIIPVIENAPSEGSPEFKERIENAMVRYPSCSAILVRNHGAFYFGSSWEETKIMAEIFEYLFKLTLEKLKFAPRLCEQIFFTTATSQ